MNETSPVSTLAPEASWVLELATEVHKRVMEYNDSTKGECYTASLAVAQLLSERGLHPRIAQGFVNDHRHFWVEVPLPWTYQEKTTLEQTVVDITADQFEGFVGVFIKSKIECFTHKVISLAGIDFDAMRYYMWV